MASINYAFKEIIVKIVYYGPGLSGKTTNLQVIHRKIPHEYRSDMVSLSTETDRTIFFDFLPLDLGKIKGFSTKFQLYTVPGQGYYNATRKLVLRGVDGIVFVADSASNKILENFESYQNLKKNLTEYGYNLEIIPIILQFNKRDLPNALAIEQIYQQLNKSNLPWNEAVAHKGIGVFYSLKLISKLVVDYLNKKYSGTVRAGGTEQRSLPASHQILKTYITPSHQYQQKKPPQQNIYQRYYQQNSASGFAFGLADAYPTKQFLSQQQSPGRFQGPTGFSYPSQTSRQRGFGHMGTLSPLYQQPARPLPKTRIPNQAPTSKQAIPPRRGQPFYIYNRKYNRNRLDPAQLQTTGLFSNEITFEPKAPSSNENTFESKLPISYTQKQDQLHSDRGYYNSGNVNLSSQAPEQFEQKQEAFFEVKFSLPPKKGDIKIGLP